ncbi:MAG TPA: ATP-binding protein [Polaromonas sp.]|uniref:hybrid sensor histidine kinase/response regulator n=1 Tax=Polaromonas sp. TaxID=1869339 RepID=UPI002D406C22|nr:ATP-binding protein [Polaromonas sp.]HYW57137.1 ATP-binding protein [Polaromonas sp.]
MPGKALRTTVQSLQRLALFSVALPLVVLATFATFRYYQLVEVAELRVNRSLRVAHEHALKVLDGAESVQARILDLVDAESPAELEKQKDELHARLVELLKEKPQVQSAWIIGSDGVPLASSRIHPLPPLNFADRAYFRFHQRGGPSPYLSEPMVTVTTGERVVDISAPFTKPDGSFGGVVNVSLHTAYFQKFHSDLVEDEPGLAVNMLHENGAIYTRWPQLANAPDKLGTNSPVMTQIRAGHTTGAVRGISSVDNRDRLITFSKVGAYPLYMGTGVDLTEVKNRWLREVGLLFAFGIPPLIGLFVAARVALRRTNDAAAAADRLGEETQTRRRAEEALLQAQKLEALGRLTGGVAHDFNNALMVISNNLFLLKRKVPDTVDPQLASITRAVESATKLTRQLLAFSRRQPLVPEHIRLQDKLPPVKELVAPVLGSKIQVSVEVASDTQSIVVDAAELELALLNLGINARDAMPNGGSFSISANNALTDIPALMTGPAVVIQARDTGTGVDPAVLEKVFEPFFTTKPVGQGTGLGLSQVYGLCQRAGGTATIESVPGAGTTVSLYFPAESSSPPAGKALASPVNRHLGKTILLVEDNNEVADALVLVLQALGCTVTRVDRAHFAREWLAAQVQLPDLLLSDVMMPGDMDGLALAKYARATYPSLNILLMTGYAEQMDIIAKSGFDILPKPCSADILADGIVKATRAPSPAA